jgi:hypothetical protein
MKVPDSKGVANHTVPESCVRNCREARREALTGVRVGQPLSRKRSLIRDADAVHSAEGNTDRRVSASAWLVLRGRRPWHARTLLVREPGDLLLGYRAVSGGPRREPDCQNNTDWNPHRAPVENRLPGRTVCLPAAGAGPGRGSWQAAGQGREPFASLSPDHGLRDRAIA